MTEAELFKELSTIPLGVHKMRGALRTDLVAQLSNTFNDIYHRWFNGEKKALLRKPCPGFIEVTVEQTKYGTPKKQFLYTNNNSVHIRHMDLRDYRHDRKKNAFVLGVENGEFAFFMKAALTMHVEWYKNTGYNDPVKRKEGVQYALYVHGGLEHLVAK